ncbi:MAG: hypothetical protein ACLPTF_15025 [Steroidobacteraceae bacterium]|jgi:hypothetical protein
MANRVERDPHPPSRKKDFDWKRFLIRSAIAIAIFNVIAGIVTWYFILP